jgi:hypothetical protein
MLLYFIKNHMWWAPCHHSIAHLQVMDGGDCIQLWIVAANISKKQSWTDKIRGWPPTLGLGTGLTTPPRKKYEMLYLDLVNNLGSGKVT